MTTKTKKKAVKPAKTTPPARQEVALTKAKLKVYALAHEGGRYNLDCARVEPDGVIQTHGRVLIWMPHTGEQRPTAPMMLHRDTMKRLAAIAPANGTVLVTQDEQSTSATARLVRRGKKSKRVFAPDEPDREIGVRAVKVNDAEAREGNYPDWRSVVPDKSTEGIVWQGDPAYLIEALEAMRHYTTVERQSVSIFIPKKADTGMLIWTHSGAAALVMPIDGDEKDLTNCPISPAKKATQ